MTVLANVMDKHWCPKYMSCNQMLWYGCVTFTASLAVSSFVYLKQLALCVLIWEDENPFTVNSKCMKSLLKVGIYFLYMYSTFFVRL
eukprot:UN00287